MRLLILLLPQFAATFTVRKPPADRAISLRPLSAESDLVLSEAGEKYKSKLFELLANTPNNAATPKAMTGDILDLVKQLEKTCPTVDSDVLESLAGNWELMWTAQDKMSPEWDNGFLRTWINPLENQSYSNNPGGRSNPILPRNLQDSLEKMGIILPDSDADVRSSQSVDIRRGRVRNVVAFEIPSPRNPLRASLTVDVNFRPSMSDQRRIDVKFDACRVLVQKSPIDVKIPLGFIGPTGWLRTVYIDKDIRITRGHKGSVFILSRSKTGQQ